MLHDIVQQAKTDISVKNNLIVKAFSLYDCKFNIKVHHLFSIAKFSQVHRSSTTHYLKKKICSEQTV